MGKVTESSNWVDGPNRRAPEISRAGELRSTCSYADIPRNRNLMKIDEIILRELHLPLVRPFETSFGVTRNRRILLAEIKSEGLTGWGECTAGERPHFSGESTDTAWQILVNDLASMLANETLE